MKVIVKRAPEDKPGDPIIDRALTNIESMLERGAHEINKSHDKVPASIDLINSTFKEHGEFIEVNDRGNQYNALITSFNLEIIGGDNPSITTTINIEGVR